MTYQIYSVRQGLYSVDRDGHLVAQISNHEGRWLAYRAERRDHVTLQISATIDVTSDLHHHDRLIPRIEALIA